MGKMTSEEFQLMVDVTSALRRVEKQLEHVYAELEEVEDKVGNIAMHLIGDIEIGEDDVTRVN